MTVSGKNSLSMIVLEQMDCMTALHSSPIREEVKKIHSLNIEGRALNRHNGVFHVNFVYCDQVVFVSERKDRPGRQENGHGLQ